MSICTEFYESWNLHCNINRCKQRLGLHVSIFFITKYSPTKPLSVQNISEINFFMESDNDEKVKQQEALSVSANAKKRYFKWDNTVSIANVLTFITIVAAFLGLYFQKKVVDSKVKDLQAVVNDLEEEKRTRTLSELELATNKLNGDSYNLDYTVTQLRATEKINNQQFIETLDQINKIVDILCQSRISPQSKIQSLEKIKLINQARREIYAHYLIYAQKIEDFEEQNAPKKENYKTNEEFLAASKIYVDTLQKNTKRLLNMLDSLVQYPKKRLKEVYSE